MKARSKGKQQANVIPGSRKRVAYMTDPVSKGDVIPHQASLPPAAQPQPFSLGHRKTSKLPGSKGKRKANIGKAFQAPSKGSATITEPTVQDPASAGLDDHNTFTFSMRPPKRSIVEWEKDRLKGSVATRQPTPGPSKARLATGSDQNATPGPSNTSRELQKKTGPSVGAEKMLARGAGTEHGPVEAGEALHGAYKEVPVVPLQNPDGQSKAAQPNHHKRGPQLRSAMKNKASSSSVPQAHVMQANSEGPSNSWASEIPVETPMAMNNTVQKLLREETQPAYASKNVDTAGSQPSEQKRWEVKQIHNTSTDQPNQAQAQVSFTTKHITESNSY
ncbi:hypothetical protein JVT61DRAFT_12134 [Boletus reticuloceps]|uniref:Uncharacterized protein n=1 Tax=Boletus reticuloceps TaxID=495285 RepID=A0A8I2YEH2_9AGAM|nr:hypothetical protein JVT61DRAFT_12134 [Boletus reticuloceps]